MTRDKVVAVCDLIRLDRQYGTILLVLPALWALLIASHGHPSPLLLAIFTAGAFLMRSAGCVINDLADHKFDRRVTRTKDRPLASGRLTIREALIVLMVLLAAAATLLLGLNWMTAALSPIAVALAVVYPFAKRAIALPQVILGAAFGWGAVMAWVAVRGQIEPPALLLFLATILWATAYDTIYALMDKEDDVRIGVHSSAILFDRHSWLAIGLLDLGMVGCLGLVGWLVQLGPAYYVTLSAAAGLLGYQTLKVRQGPDRTMAFSLFRANTWVGALVLAGIVAG